MVSHNLSKFGGHRHSGSGHMNILANMVILPKMWDVRDCIRLLTSTIVIFSKARCMLCATRISNNNLRRNSYGNFLFPMK